MKGLMAVMGVALIALLVGLVSLSSPTVDANGTITVKQSNVGPNEICEEGTTGEWHLIINQIANQSPAPASIEVTFSDGHTHIVSLGKLTPGGVAHYTIFTHLTDTLVTATADIYDGWRGRFNVSHTPCVPVCEEEVCNTPTPTPPPSATPTPTPTLTPTPTTTPTPTADTSTLETPLSLPNTGGESSGSGGLDWVAIFMMVAGIAGVAMGTVIVIDLIRNWRK